MLRHVTATRAFLLGPARPDAVCQSCSRPFQLAAGRGSPERVGTVRRPDARLWTRGARSNRTGCAFPGTHRLILPVHVLFLLTFFFSSQIPTLHFVFFRPLSGPQNQQAGSSGPTRPRPRPRQVPQSLGAASAPSFMATVSATGGAGQIAWRLQVGAFRPLGWGLMVQERGGTDQRGSKLFTRQ